LEFAQKLVETLIPKPPDAAMLDTDPVGFMKADRAYREIAQKLQQVRQGLHNVDSRVQEHGRVQTQQERETELSALVEKIPALSTEQARTAFFQEASNIASKAYGFTPDEIGAFTDHRYIVALRDAVEYRKLQSKKMEAVRQAKQAHRR
jgi:hypothetical protein